MANVLILHADSRESLLKARDLASACALTGDTAQLSDGTDRNELDAVHPDLVIPVSDQLAPLVYSLSMRARGCEPDPAIAAALVSKRAAYDLLSRAGFDTLPAYAVHTARDALEAPIDGPVFLKPDRSSGAQAPHPFGYRRFESAAAAGVEIARVCGHGQIMSKGQATIFGSYLIMPHVEHELNEVHGVIAVQGAAHQSILPRFYGKVDPRSLFVRYISCDTRSGDGGTRAAFAALRRSGFELPFAYVQFLPQGARRFATDLNLRMSTMWNDLLAAGDPTFHARCIDYLLGRTDRLDVGFPRRHALLGRIQIDPTRGVEDVTVANGLDAGAVWLRRRGIDARSAAYDDAHSHPTFAVFTDTHDDAVRRYADITAHAHAIQT